MSRRVGLWIVLSLPLATACDAPSPGLLGLCGEGPTCFDAPPKQVSMVGARESHASAQLSADGRLLIAGGRQADETPFGHSVGAAEIFVPNLLND